MKNEYLDDTKLLMFSFLSLSLSTVNVRIYFVNFHIKSVKSFFYKTFITIILKHAHQ